MPETKDSTELSICVFSYTYVLSMIKFKVRHLTNNKLDNYKNSVYYKLCECGLIRSLPEDILLYCTYPCCNDVR